MTSRSRSLAATDLMSLEQYARERDGVSRVA